MINSTILALIPKKETPEKWKIIDRFYVAMFCIRWSQKFWQPGLNWYNFKLYLRESICVCQRSIIDGKRVACLRVSQELSQANYFTTMLSKNRHLHGLWHGLMGFLVVHTFGFEATWKIYTLDQVMRYDEGILNSSEGWIS